MKVTLRQVIYVAGLVLSVTVTAVALAAYSSFKSLHEKSAWVDHTHQVLNYAEKATMLIKEVQTSQQSFIITGDSAYLTRYQSASDSVKACLNRLQRLTADNPRQQSLIATLTRTTLHSFTLQKQALNLKANTQPADFRQFYNSSENQRAVDQTSQALQAVITEENHLLRQRNKQLDTSIAFTKSILFSVLAASVVVFAGLFGVIYFQLRRKERYERELHTLNQDLYAANEEMTTYNEELTANQEELMSTVDQLESIRGQLEQRVAERTATLKKANEHLLQEVTERKRTEGALRQSEERFRVALANAPVTVYMQDDQLRYTWIHNSHLGYINRSALHQTDYDIFSRSDADLLTQLKRRVMDSREGCQEEVWLTVGGKQYCYVLSIEPLYGTDGDTAGVTCAAYDITEQKQSEENLRAALHELKKRNYELDNYVYKVSHDLRAPLSSMMGLVNLVKMEASAAPVQQYMQLIENRANKLDEFIKSILNHSKMINSAVTVTEIDFGQIIRECAEELRYMPNWDKVQADVDLSGETEFYSDAFRLGILFKNFLSNAIKYFDSRKMHSYVRFAVQVTGQEAYIQVEDNGIGIEQPYVDKIFDMFFRGTEKSDGSGLGLYIVKQTIEKLNGRISVTSQRNVGTTFHIFLPNRVVQSHVRQAV